MTKKEYFHGLGVRKKYHQGLHLQGSTLQVRLQALEGLPLVPLRRLLLPPQLQVLGLLLGLHRQLYLVVIHMEYDAPSLKHLQVAHLGFPQTRD
jgi:hypothetical protein